MGAALQAVGDDGRALRGGRRGGGQAGGFTLVEVVVTIALLVVLAGVGALSFTNWFSSERLPAAANRVESLLRLARAEAAARGKRVRLEFRQDAASASPRATFTWEPEPLAEPGQYVPFTAASWTADLGEDLARFTRCERTGDSALNMATFGGGAEVTSSDGRPLQSVTFQPDGTCDSAVIELVSGEDSDLRTAVITLDSASGEVAVQVLTPTEMNAQQ